MDWIGLDLVEFWRMLRGLDWIGSDYCYVQNFDGLCFSAKQSKQTKTVLCNKLIIIDFLHT